METALMKRFIDKKLVLALLMSASGLHASGDGMSMSYFRQSLNFVGHTAQQGLSFVGRQVGSTVKNHPYITMAVLAYEFSMRYYGLSNWTLSHGVSLLSKKIVDRARALNSVKTDVVTPVVDERHENVLSDKKTDITAPVVGSSVITERSEAVKIKPLPVTPVNLATKVKKIPVTPGKSVEKIKPSSTTSCKSEVVVANQQELTTLLEGLSNGSVAIDKDSEATFVPLCESLLETKDVERLKRLFQLLSRGGVNASYRASIIALLKKAAGSDNQRVIPVAREI
jgi:hypothetical protein